MIPARGITSSQVISGNILNSLGNYLPQFIAGLTLLLVGLVLAMILKELILRFLVFLKVEDLFGNISRWLNKMKAGQSAERGIWPKLVAELVRWTVIILFLAPVTQIWGLPKAADLLNQLLLYIPNVFVAIVIALVGVAVANLVSEIVVNAGKNLGSAPAKLLGTTARYALIFFTVLVVLNQLGVAADLIRILFTGIVAMMALAGGLAFGLGGRSTASKVLAEFEKKIGS